MKKNILTIIIMAIVLINTILTAVLIFAIVPTANRTTKLVDKVASIVDLELESTNGDGDIAVSDIVGYDIADQLTINLVSSDNTTHYALLNVSLSMNSKNPDYEELKDKVQENENAIKEIVTDEFSKYTVDEVKTNKEAIKKQILTDIQDYFKSDFIISVSFGNIVLS